jgi:predicted nucleic acid-binding protein
MSYWCTVRDPVAVRYYSIDKIKSQLYNYAMDIVADASTFLSVALEEPGYHALIEKTLGKLIVSPEVLPYEIANALIAGKKRKRHQLTDKDIHLAYARSQRIPVRLVQIRIDEALKLALRWNIYAYDAYYLQCARENELPLLSLDGNMLKIAKAMKITVME